MPRPVFNLWLHRFAVLTALATLWLLAAGGLVTSHGVGMAVPDWPNTYGYNMFLFPPSKWVGGIFYEHTHRLIASGVGLLTLILAVWLWRVETRRWLRWLGVIAFLVVVFQGVLGGLRVVLFKDEIGIFHATLAQLFFALVSAIAIFTSRWWQSSVSGCEGKRVSEEIGSPHPPAHLLTHPLTPAGALTRKLYLIATSLIFLQLILGATMRHQHAGLAIPDFPLAYGKVWPAMDAAAIELYNARRVETTAANSITAFQVGLQMAHRLMAVVILVCVGAIAWRGHRREEAERVVASPPPHVGGYESGVLRRLAFLWLTLIFVQAGLGAWTIWSNKAADVATAHVLVGALSLVTGVAGCLICFHRFARVSGTQGVSVTASPPISRPMAAVNS